MISLLSKGIFDGWNKGIVLSCKLEDIAVGSEVAGEMKLEAGLVRFKLTIFEG